jgi:hypothetical protein
LSTGCPFCILFSPRASGCVKDRFLIPLTISRVGDFESGSCFISIEVESTVPSFQCCVGVLWCPVVFLVNIQQPVGSRASQLQYSVVLEGNLGTVAILREILNWLPFTTI